TVTSNRLGWKMRRRKAALKIGACVVGVVVASRASAVTSTWLSATSGNWNTPGNWNPNSVPTNNTFNVTVDATGSPSTVTIDARPTIKSLAVTSADATVTLGNVSTFTLPTLNISAGTFQLNAAEISGCTITPSGSGTFSPTNAFNNRLTNSSSYV